MKTNVAPVRKPVVLGYTISAEALMAAAEKAPCLSCGKPTKVNILDKGAGCFGCPACMPEKN